jgi:hypothetical protein
VGLGDVQILALKAPGTWHRRQWAEERGDGVYTVSLVPPEAGVYYAFVGCESRGLGLQEGGYVVVHVGDPESSEPSRVALPSNPVHDTTR